MTSLCRWNPRQGLLCSRGFQNIARDAHRSLRHARFSGPPSDCSSPNYDALYRIQIVSSCLPTLRSLLSSLFINTVSIVAIRNSSTTTGSLQGSGKGPNVSVLISLPLANGAVGSARGIFGVEYSSANQGHKEVFRSVRPLRCVSLRRFECTPQSLRVDLC